MRRGAITSEDQMPGSAHLPPAAISSPVYGAAVRGRCYFKPRRTKRCVRRGRVARLMPRGPRSRATDGTSGHGGARAPPSVPARRLRSHRAREPLRRRDGGGDGHDAHSRQVQGAPRFTRHCGPSLAGASAQRRRSAPAGSEGVLSKADGSYSVGCGECAGARPPWTSAPNSRNERSSSVVSGPFSRASRLSSTCS